MDHTPPTSTSWSLWGRKGKTGLGSLTPRGLSCMAQTPQLSAVSLHFLPPKFLHVNSAAVLVLPSLAAVGSRGQRLPVSSCRHGHTHTCFQCMCVHMCVHMYTYCVYMFIVQHMCVLCTYPCTCLFPYIHVCAHACTWPQAHARCSSSSDYVTQGGSSLFDSGSRVLCAQGGSCRPSCNRMWDPSPAEILKYLHRAPSSG